MFPDETAHARPLTILYSISNRTGGEEDTLNTETPIDSRTKLLGNKQNENPPDPGKHDDRSNKHQNIKQRATHSLIAGKSAQALACPHTRFKSSQCSVTVHTPSVSHAYTLWRSTTSFFCWSFTVSSLFLKLCATEDAKMRFLVVETAPGCPLEVKADPPVELWLILRRLLSPPAMSDVLRVWGLNPLFVSLEVPGCLERLTGKSASSLVKWALPGTLRLHAVKR